MIIDNFITNSKIKIIMGKIKKSVLGGVNGGIGNMIGSSWKGISYLKMKPASVANPRTPDQVTQRNRFKGVQRLSHQLLDAIVKPIWNRMAVKMTGTNLFIKKNIDFFDKEGKISDYAKIKISIGRLSNPSEIEITRDPSADGSYIISWNNASMTPETHENDKLNLVILNESNPSIDPIEIPELALRKDMLYQFTPKGAVDDKLHVYAYFSNERRSLFSESTHLPISVYKK